SDLRVRIHGTGLTTYPDGAVICGKTARAADDPIAVTNPVLLIEVTSTSTEDYDRGGKVRHYQRLPSVREILIVSHREPWLTLRSRAADLGGNWTTEEARTGQTLELASIPARLAVDDIYRDELEDAGRP